MCAVAGCLILVNVAIYWPNLRIVTKTFLFFFKVFSPYQSIHVSLLGVNNTTHTELFGDSFVKELELETLALLRMKWHDR